MLCAYLIPAVLLATPAPPIAGILPAGAIEVVPSTEHLVLGDGTTLTLTMRVYDATGAPEDLRPPTLLTSIGEVGAVRRVAPGTFEASFTPPAAGSPRVAIILARVHTRAGPIAGWCRIPLWGRGQLKVQTKPAAQVLLRIGDQAFGPVESDGRGRASIAILVPPGPRHGVAETVDRAGNTSKKTIDLGVKPFDRLAAFALDDHVVADGGQQSGVLAFAVDGRGVPLVDAPISSRCARGETSAPVPLAPGVYRIPYRASGGIGDGSDEVNVELKHDRVSRVRVQIRLSAGDPEEIQLEVTPASYRAGSAQAPQLALRALDAAGNPAPASLIDLTVEGGVLGVATPDGQGGVRIPIEIADQFKGRQALTVRAHARRGDATATSSVKLIPGACARVEVSGPRRLLCDGRSEIYSASCADRFGNRTPFAAQRVSGSPLVVEAVEAGDGRTLRIRVRTPVLDRATSVALSVQAKEVAGALRVELDPGVRLQAVLGPRLVAGWSYGSSWLAGAALDWHLAFPLGGGALLVGASAAALSSPPLGGAPQSDATLRRLQIFPVTLELAYQARFLDRLVGRAGIGVGPVLGAPTFDRAGLTLDQELAVSLLGEASAGLGVQLGRGVLEATLRAGYGLPLRTAAAGQLGGIWTGLGYRVSL